ncbi:hypothetical protein [Paracidovorax avenae]|uniref:hypothetical protein n=1 Tax=Paracidovorax avenae TaxID=80867 RepID=UPI000FE257F3|nr:hypothetical protein [Paracidovorax avenae]
MSLDQIVEFVKSNITSFPAWFTSIFWHLVAAILLVFLLTLLFKAASNTDFKNPVLAILRLIANALKAFFAGSFKAIESPIERPKTKLVIKGLAIVHSYLMCLFFFAFFLALFFAMVVSDVSPNLWLRIAQLGILLIALYLTAFFRAEADRDWLRFKEQLKVVRSGPAQ